MNFSSVEQSLNGELTFLSLTLVESFEVKLAVHLRWFSSITYFDIYIYLKDLCIFYTNLVAYLCICLIFFYVALLLNQVKSNFNC